MDRLELKKSLLECLENISFNNFNETFTYLTKNVFPFILPEFLLNIDVQQNKYHRFPVDEHIAVSVGLAEKFSLEVKLALLFHDIGKYSTKSVDESGEIHFYGHEHVSYQIVRAFLINHEFEESHGQKFVTRVENLVKYHMLPLWLSKRYIRRLLNKIGQDAIEDFLSVKLCDHLAGHIDYDESFMKTFSMFKILLQEVIADKKTSKRILDITGEEIMEILNIPESKLVGTVIKNLEKLVAENIIQNKNDILKKILQFTINYKL